MTGFNYVADHHQIVELILTTLGSVSMKATIAWLNQEILNNPDPNTAKEFDNTDDNKVDTLAQLIGEYTLDDYPCSQLTVDIAALVNTTVAGRPPVHLSCHRYPS